MPRNVKILSNYFIISLTMIVLQGCSRPDNEIMSSVRNQLQRYPESSLQDIYKSFFQDEFGPGHLLNDTARAREYLDYEIEEMTSAGNYIAEPCGTGKNFFRIPLDLVKDGIIPYETYFAAFMESAASFRSPETSEWKVKWEKIVLVIQSMDLEIANFEGERLGIARMLNSGEAVVHHSKKYEELYNPHYRIMGKEQWEGLNSKFKVQSSKFKVQSSNVNDRLMTT